MPSVASREVQVKAFNHRHQLFMFMLCSLKREFRPLPEEIIMYIISFLPFFENVATYPYNPTAYPFIIQHPLTNNSWDRLFNNPMTKPEDKLTDDEWERHLNFYIRYTGRNEKYKGQHFRLGDNSELYNDDDQERAGIKWYGHDDEQNVWACLDYPCTPFITLYSCMLQEGYVLNSVITTYAPFSSENHSLLKIKTTAKGFIYTEDESCETEEFCDCADTVIQCYCLGYHGPVFVAGDYNKLQ